MNVTNRPAALMAVAAMILLAGCGNGEATSSTPSSSPTEETSSTLLLPDGDSEAVETDAETEDSETSESTTEDNEAGESSTAGTLAPGDTGETEPAGDSTDEPPGTTIVPQIADEFGPADDPDTTDVEAINKIGNDLVNAWWYPEDDTTYEELADGLETKETITEELADLWREQGSQTIVPAPEDTEVLRMWPVRVEQDNATFQISSLAEGEDEETWTFIEFVKEGGSWKATGIE